MSDNVVSLFGQDAIGTTRAPVERLVHEPERLLEAARAGDIVGFAGSFQHRSSVVGYVFAGAVDGYSMMGGLERVEQRLTRRATEANRE